jgi:hypothetical protein
MNRGKRTFLTLLILVFYLLHQDFWNWKTVEPLLLGFLPVGLAYHAGYSVAAACLMAVLVKIAWPSHLEKVTEAKSESDRKGADR